VVAPDLGDVDLVFRGKPPRDIDRSGGHIQVKRRSRPAEVRPLSHRLQLVHRFRGLHFKRAHEFVSAFGGREDQVREYLHLPYPDRHRLILPDIRHDIVAPLEAHLKQANHSVMLQLLANGTDQYRAHTGLRRGRDSAVVRKKEPAIITICHFIVYAILPALVPALTPMSFAIRMMQ
jgi:hypothetical protein